MRHDRADPIMIGQTDVVVAKHKRIYDVMCLMI